MSNLTCVVFIVALSGVLTAQTDSLRLYFPSDTVVLVTHSQFPVPENGKVVTNHAIGSTAEEYYHRNGLKFGNYRAFYPSGQLAYHVVYAFDKMNGEWSLYNESGKLVEKGKYKNGIKHGYWAFLEEGWYGRYENGLKKGKWKRIENFFVVERKWYDKKTGLEKTFDKANDTTAETTKEPKAKPISSSRQQAVAANMVMNPRFRENIKIGMEVVIVPAKTKDKSERVTGKVKEILTKRSFDGLGIKVKLVNDREGRVVELIDRPEDFTPAQ